MKKLAKTIISCILGCLALSASAQSAPFHFGVKAGFNLSSAFVDDASAQKFMPGYHVGPTAEYRVSESFLIQSGLLFSKKGSKIEDLNKSSYAGGIPDMTHTYNQLYLELPVYGSYRIILSDKLNFVLGAGPYFGYGVGGKTKEKLNSGVWGDGKTEIEWNTFSDGVYDEGRDWLRGESLNHFDFGLGLKADLEFNHLVLGFGASASLINISRYNDYTSYRNFNLSLSVGYRF